MKGMIHTMEAVFGSVIILVGIMLIFPSQQKNEIDFSKISYSCLEHLDQSGLLRNYAISNSITELNNSLRSCLPQIADFKFKICSISNCRDITVPYDRTVYLSSYLIAGENTYNKRLVNLWVWLK